MHLDSAAAAPATRRRGDVLEAAVLDAAWDQLVAGGYAGFTFEAVAERAGTSRPVLYRRWPDRRSLLVAAIRRASARRRIRIPDTGSLRGDAIGLLRSIDRSRIGFAAVVSVLAGEFFAATGTSLADLRELIRAGSPSSFEAVLGHAAARGELDPDRIPERVKSVATDLYRHELLLTLAPISDATIEAIVDEVWLPLLRSYGAEV